MRARVVYVWCVHVFGVCVVWCVCTRVCGVHVGMCNVCDCMRVCAHLLTSVCVVYVSTCVCEHAHVWCVFGVCVRVVCARAYVWWCVHVCVGVCLCVVCVHMV